MNTLTAFYRGMVSKDKEMKVFDWDKAAQLIKERNPEIARAGLSGDWEYTGGDIWRDGKPVLDSYTFLSSTWATPKIEIDGEFIECYIMERETEWDSSTKWPESALEKLKN